MTSKQSETYAAEIIQTWVGASGSVEIPNKSDASDFVINFSNGDLGIGEVKLDANTAKTETESLLYGLPKSQRLPLNEGTGSWAVELSLPFNLKPLMKHLPQLLEKLSRQKVDTLFEAEMLDLPVRSDWDRLGIRQIHRLVDDSQNEAVIFPELIAGQVPIDSNAAVPWIENFVRKEQHASTWLRLKKSLARQKHLFIWINNETPKPIQLRVSHHPGIPPLVEPILPSWITHIWVGIPISFANERFTWLFDKHLGWQAIPINNTV